VAPRLGPRRQGSTPLIAGGRSAGSQVACRTAKTLGAAGVVALSYPLLGPGSPRELLDTALPLLIVQGGADPYGRPNQFPSLPSNAELVEIPYANHTFGTTVGAGATAAAPVASVAQAVTDWLEDLLRRLENETGVSGRRHLSE
jgi:uncharacterized protein